MKCLVTGAAGFIGSHLCEELLHQGWDTVALDAFIPNYPEVVKQRNLLNYLSHPHCRFYRVDLRTDRLDELLEDVQVVFHCAGMPGVTNSWMNLEDYWSCNVLATRQLLDAVRRSVPALRSFLYISSSAVYGVHASGDESMPTQPVSPYGVTKLAGEQLCRDYAENYGLPLVTLRYFSVYGPRQRPDMGYYRFIHAMLRNEPVVVHGDGHQMRGNIYVSDCVRAAIAAVKARPGEIYNVGGNETASVWDILHRLERLAGRPAKVNRAPPRPGDQRHTIADTTKLRSHLGWEPLVRLDEGLAFQWEWQNRQGTCSEKNLAVKQTNRVS